MTVSTVAPTAEIAVSANSYSITVEVPTNSIAVSAVGPPGPSGSRSRTTSTVTTPSISPNAVHPTTVALATGYCLYHIQTSAPCRFRLYTGTAERDADLTRPIGTYPPQNSGLLFEFVSTPALLQAPLAPPPMGFLRTVPPVPPYEAPVSVTNLHTAAAAIEVVLTWVEMEF